MKKLWESRAFWVNFIAICGLVAQRFAGYELSAESQVSILAIVNVLIRIITKKEIVW